MPGKIFINETADKQKVELTTGADGVTGGYYDHDGVWHEFEGGGNSLQPVLHLTLKSEDEDQYALYNVIVENSNGTLSYADFELEPSQEVTFSTLLIGDDEGNYLLNIPVYKSSTNLSNCTIEEQGGNYFIFITDPTKEATAYVVVGED